MKRLSTAGGTAHCQFEGRLLRVDWKREKLSTASRRLARTQNLLDMRTTATIKSPAYLHCWSGVKLGLSGWSGASPAGSRAGLFSSRTPT